MCIIFIYNGYHDEDSEFSLVIATNRDEFYKRPSQNMAPWREDPNVIGGRDLEAECSGTWLAVSPLRKKLGVLLNLPRQPKSEAKSRGTIVADFVKSDITIHDYVQQLQHQGKKYNDFVFVTVELSSLSPSIHTYSNSTDALTNYNNICLGFSNSIPEVSLRKVEVGQSIMQEICTKFNKVSLKDTLVDKLISFLRSEERHLPDPELQKWRPTLINHLSSIFVSIPESGYGTRTHTIILVTKSGHADIIEYSLQPPIDIENPNWHISHYKFDV